MIRCLFKATDITPCAIEDGPLAFARVDGRATMCLGCERSIDRVNEDLEARGHDPVDPGDRGEPC